jgi:hypothetical protein
VAVIGAKEGQTMPHNAEKVSDLLAQVERLLGAGTPAEAAELIRHFGTGSPEVSNAYGVALLRAGDSTKAVEVYRNLCVNQSGFCLKSNLPTVFKANYATALLLAGNVSGCLSILQETNDDQNASVQRVRAVIRRWRKSLTWWERLWFTISGEPPAKPVPADFQPGELLADRELKPAA